jgi:subtilisin family serine protease
VPLLALVVSLASTGRGATQAPDVLVRLRPATAAVARATVERAGGTVVARDLDVWRLPASAAARALPPLRASDSVVFAHPEQTYTAAIQTVSLTDPLVPQEWWRQAVGVAQLTPPGPGVPVTLVDSGVDLQHPEFVGRPDLVMLNTQEPQPIGGVHGTAVASVVGAPENGVGIVGIYPQSVIRSWDAATGLGTELTSSGIVDGILAATQAGKSVINLSLGGPSPDPTVQAAVDLAVSRGSLVVAASGNEGEDGSPLTYPAALPHVLTVAATQPDGAVTSWSSRSRFVDIAAPGAQIVVATVDPVTGTTGWEPEDGTSFASPLVAGAAAWLWTVRPRLDADQVAQILRATATDIGTAGRDQASGFGLLDVPAALAAPAPVKDQTEPNDQPSQVTPGGTGYHGTPALTRPGRLANRVTGRVDAAEDPRDIYRVWLPRGHTLTARVTADQATSLTLVRAGTADATPPLTRPDLLQRGSTPSTSTTLTYRNTGAGRHALLVVEPKTRALTTYRLAVAARPLR